MWSGIGTTLFLALLTATFRVRGTDGRSVREPSSGGRETSCDTENAGNYDCQGLNIFLLTLLDTDATDVGAAARLRGEPATDGVFILSPNCTDGPATGGEGSSWHRLDPTGIPLRDLPRIQVRLSSTNLSRRALGAYISLTDDEPNREANSRDLGECLEQGLNVHTACLRNVGTDSETIVCRRADLSSTVIENAAKDVSPESAPLPPVLVKRNVAVDALYESDGSDAVGDSPTFTAEQRKEENEVRNTTIEEPVTSRLAKRETVTRPPRSFDDDRQAENSEAKLFRSAETLYYCLIKFVMHTLETALKNDGHKPPLADASSIVNGWIRKASL